MFPVGSPVASRSFKVICSSSSRTLCCALILGPLFGIVPRGLAATLIPFAPCSHVRRASPRPTHSPPTCLNTPTNKFYNMPAVHSLLEPGPGRGRHPTTAAGVHLSVRVPVRTRAPQKRLAQGSPSSNTAAPPSLVCRSIARIGYVGLES